MLGEAGSFCCIRKRIGRNQSKFSSFSSTYALEEVKLRITFSYNVFVEHAMPCAIFRFNSSAVVKHFFKNINYISSHDGHSTEIKK